MRKQSNVPNREMAVLTVFHSARFYSAEPAQDIARQDIACQDILAIEGVSLRPAFTRESLDRKDALYFEHHLNCAVRDGQWKLVRKGIPGKDAKLVPWELYNMQTDRTEMNNLADQDPQKVAELAAKWEAWAKRANVKPWPWKIDEPY